MPESLLDLPRNVSKPAIFMGAGIARAAIEQLILPLFALTLFISSALLFLIEPMFAKMVLPLLGGTPAVWNTCMVCFQALLLAGYAYGHWSIKWFGVRRQAPLQILLLLVATISLPVTIAHAWNPPVGGNPVGWLILVLIASVGLPFFAVSTTGPVIQRWLVASGHKAGRDPYFLYAASNLGSMLALLAYPTIVEPLTRLSRQGHLWTFGYLSLIALTACCALCLRPNARDERQTSARPETIAAMRRLRWIILAFVPSSQLLGATTFITTDIAAVPLFWIVPLVLYLLSFILVMSQKKPIPDRAMIRALPILTLGVVLVMLGKVGQPVWMVLALHLGALFATSMVCHAQLANDRPSAGNLTDFYLTMSLGGVLGGLFNGLLAPVIFQSVAEYPIALVLACALCPSRAKYIPSSPCTQGEDRGGGLNLKWRPTSLFTEYLHLRFLKSEANSNSNPHLYPPPEYEGRKLDKKSIDSEACPTNPCGKKTRHLNLLPEYREKRQTLFDILWPIGVGLLAWKLPASIPPQHSSLRLLAIGIPVVLAIPALRRRWRFVGTLAALFFVAVGIAGNGQILSIHRSFFGIHRIVRNSEGPFNDLYHGTTVHGRQRVDALTGQPTDPQTALTYYHQSGPIGQIMSDVHHKNIVVVGLGVGSLAAYADQSTHLTYYEIDPAVRWIADESGNFSFLSAARNRGAHINIIMGDARLTLRDTPAHSADLLVLDAFSGDAVPVHLLTREAMALYRHALREDGVLAFHVSNMYLDLHPVVAGLAKDAGWVGLYRDDLDLNSEQARQGKLASQWVVLAPGSNRVATLLKDPRWHPLPIEQSVLWSDEYSNVLGVFRWK